MKPTPAYPGWVRLRLANLLRPRALATGRALFGAWLILLGGSVARAAELAPKAETANPGASITFTPGFVSQYMFRGVHIEGPSWQSSLEATAGNLAFGVWTNFPAAHEEFGEATDEIDPYASYRFALTDKLSLVPALQVYTYPHADLASGSYRSTVEPNVGLSYAAGPVTLAPKLYYDVVARAITAEFNLNVSFAVVPLGTRLDVAGTVGTYAVNRTLNTSGNALPQIRARGSYWLLGVSMPVTLPVGRLTVGYAYTSGFATRLTASGYPASSNPLAMGRPVLSLSYAFDF